jgi:hypothetical protein
MTPSLPHRPKRLPRGVHVLLAIVLLGVGSEVCAVPAFRACQLHMPCGWVIYLTPIFGVAAYAATGRLLCRTRLGQAGWAVAYAVGGLLISTPTFVEASYTRSIRLPRWLEPEEKAGLSARFPHPYIESSATSEGTRLLIKRSDYDPSLVQFLKSIHALPDT